MTEDHGKSRGRPRSEQVHNRILDVAEHLVERQGYTALTIEQIADEAGVSKATLYRRWPSKAQLVLEVVTDRWYEPGELPDTGTTRGDLIEFMTVNFRNQSGIGGQVIQQLAADLHDPHELGDVVRERFANRRAEMGLAILKRGISRGDLPKDADVELLLDLASGVPLAQQFRSGSIRSLKDVAAIVDLLLSGTIPRKRRRR